MAFCAFPKVYDASCKQQFTINNKYWFANQLVVTDTYPPN